MTMTQPQGSAKAGLVGAVLALLASAAPIAAQDFSAPNQMPPLASGAESDDVAAQAGTRITEYLGGGYMGFSEECEAHGWSGTQQIMVRLQPQGMPGNDANESQVAIYFPTGTIAFRYDRTEFDGNNMYAPHPIDTAVYVWNGPWVPEMTSMQLHSFARYGGFISSGDQRIHSLYMMLNNFNELEGCRASMRVSIARS